MLSGATIKNYTDKYTNFQVSSGGVTRTPQIPYYLGGKKTPDQIQNYILSNTSSFSNGVLKSNSELESLMNQNKSNSGVDCSGLVYYALNEASNGAVRTYFENELGLSGTLSYAYGLSAEHLTDPERGTLIDKARNIVPGCTIRIKPSEGSSVNHVMVVYGVHNIGGQYIIRYAHSSSGAGPHNGYIVIGNLDKDLNDISQTWYDSAISDSTMKTRYDYTMLLECI